MSQLDNPAVRAISAAALLGMILLATPAPAATGHGAMMVAQATTSAPPPPPAGQPPASPPPQMQKQHSPGGIDARINSLHRRLHITKAQDAQWETVAQVMRENATAMEALAHERYENADKMTAVDDLRSYSALADAHADGLKKFVPVFAQLYDSMSPAQKKIADTLFRNRMHAHKKAAPKAKPKAE